MNRLPQGGRDSSAQLERIIVEQVVRPFEKSFGDKASLVVCRDNLFLATEDFGVHSEALKWLAECCQKLNLKFGSGTIGSQSVSVLGFELTPDSVRPARAALEKLRSIPTPNTRKELRALLGSFNYYRSLVPDYAKLVARLEELLRKDVRFQWDQGHDADLDRVKEALERASTGRFDPGQGSVIYTDASDLAAGAALVQGSSIVAVFSRKFRGAQLAYSVTRREALALLWAVEHFSDMLVGTTPVYTDHKALVHWARGSVGDDLLLNRWGLKLREHAVAVVYLPGNENGIADFLSRHTAIRTSDEQPKERASVEEDRSQVVLAQRRNPTRTARTTFNGVLRAPVDRNERLSWLERLHFDSNHGSVRAMESYLRGQVDWPTKAQDLAEVVATCDLCQREAVARKPKQAHLVTSRSSWRIFDEFSVDLITEMPVTRLGHRNVLHVQESFSGFSWLIALRQKEGPEVAAGLLRVFLSVGFPRRVRCDRGEVLSGPVHELLDWAGVVTKPTSSHHPEANGMVERSNLEIRREIARMGDDDSWDLQLDAIAFFRNSRPSRRADVSAFQLLYQVEPRVPMVERLLPAVEERTIALDQPWSAMLKHEANRRQAALLEFQERMREYERGRRQERQIGELVLVRNFARKKGEPRWRGPYPITKVGRQSLGLRTDAGRDLVVNLSDVKAYRHALRAAVVEQGSVSGADDHNIADATFHATAGTESAAAMPPTNSTGYPTDGIAGQETDT